MRNINDTSGEALHTPAEVADLLGVSKATVLRRYQSGDLPGLRFGPRSIRFRAADVDAFVARSASPATEKVS